MAIDDDDTPAEEKDEDLEEAEAEASARRKRGRGPEAAAGAAKIKSSPNAATSARDSERKKRELITRGKAKGFLTYDEVNEHLPENIVSSEQMDDWLTAFSGEGIELVESATKLKVAEKVEPAAADDDDDEQEADPEQDQEQAAKKVDRDEDEDEDSEASAKTTDPVRMYLRRMGSVSLLTREGEVEIAKRIEEGERRVLLVVLNSSVAIEDILDLGDRLRAGTIRVKEVVKDADDEDAEFDEQWHIDRVCKVIDNVRRIYREQEKAAVKLTAAGAADPQSKRLRKQIEAFKFQILDALADVRLAKRQIDRIVLRLKEFVSRIELANLEILECEQRSGLDLPELKKTLKEIRSSELRQRSIAKKMGIHPEEIEEMSCVVSA
ncbi:MAG: RNA polymerase sigma factor region1.1 domain-containing protein, partial [Pseudomonadota bacterium]